jgi:hypothetical protein
MPIYNDVIQKYERNKIRGGLWFLSMSLVAAICGIGLNNAWLAGVSGLVGLAIALAHWRHRLRVIRRDDPNNLRSSLWEIEYRGYSAPIDEAKIEELQVRHSLERVSEN